MNDHISEQMDVDVEELVPGAARATSLETPEYESTFRCDGLCGKKRLRYYDVGTSVIHGLEEPHTVNECLDRHK